MAKPAGSNFIFNQAVFPEIFTLTEGIPDGEDFFHYSQLGRFFQIYNVK
jgi:hypothetical protein